MLKFLSNFLYYSKNYLSLNVVSLLCWILIFYLLFNRNPSPYFVVYGVLFFIPLFLFSGTFITCTIEYIFELKIKNKFILENKYYNIFFIIGYIIFIMYISVIFIIYVYTLLQYIIQRN